jgi:hypothetical protein
MTGCYECGDEPSGSGATELVNYAISRKMAGKNALDKVRALGFSLPVPVCVLRTQIYTGLLHNFVFFGCLAVNET